MLRHFFMWLKPFAAKTSRDGSKGFVCDRMTEIRIKLSKWDCQVFVNKDIRIRQRELRIHSVTEQNKIQIDGPRGVLVFGTDTIESLLNLTQ